MNSRPSRTQVFLLTFAACALVGFKRSSGGIWNERPEDEGFVNDAAMLIRPILIPVMQTSSRSPQTPART